LGNRFEAWPLWGNRFAEMLWGTALGSSFGEPLWGAALASFPEQLCRTIALKKGSFGEQLSGAALQTTSERSFR
jgi:hypothetical protein